MNILFATSEAHPLVKTGGLGDVSGSLPNALAALKHKVRLVLPAYRDVMHALPPNSLRKVAQLPVDGCTCRFTATIWQLKAGAVDGIEVPVWLVDIPQLFDRPGNPYLAEDGRDWWDNGERFGVFSKVVAMLSLGRAGLKWVPDAVHLNDWQTGLVAALLSVEASRPKTVFTVHNMAYPGNFPHSLFAQLQLPPVLWSLDGVEFWGQFSMLKAGLAKADWVTTVSPTYAREICSERLAYGFEGVLQRRANEGHLVGVLNGIDEHVWHPQTDKLIAARYGADKGLVAGKRRNKRYLLQEMARLAGQDDKQIEAHLPVWLEAPLIGLVGRLVEQKGIDLVLEVLPQMLAETSAHFVFVGSGDKAYEARLAEVAKRYPLRVWTYIGYSERLAHQVEAGADLFLMPSRFEPCGLNQMYSLVYGTPPVVHHTGGLADTVVPATDENLKNGLATGFVFYEMSPYALKTALDQALRLFSRKRLWQRLQKNAMQQDFGWRVSAKRYVQLYAEE
jgi:starch synthase